MKIYEEIHTDRDVAPKFPNSCPICGLQRTGGSKYGETSYRAFVTYACGGGFELKSQIQRHTDKWWGGCGIPLEQSH